MAARRRFTGDSGPLPAARERRVEAGAVIGMKLPSEGGSVMFIAMNRFKVVRGEEKAFEDLWLNRESHLDKVPGFVEFHMLRGPERDDHTLYSSHTIWADRDRFTAWTTSEQFRSAHGSAGSTRQMYLGHPEFEGFEVIQTIAAPKPDTASA